MTKEDYESNEKIEIPEEPPGIVYPSGDINWDCPCLGDLPSGPCGREFRAAFSCFHFSREETKGSDCIPAFKDMQDCFMAHPEIYGDDEDGEENGDGKDGNVDINDGNVDINDGSIDINEGKVGGSDGDRRRDEGEVSGDEKGSQRDS